MVSGRRLGYLHASGSWQASRLCPGQTGASEITEILLDDRADARPGHSHPPSALTSSPVAAMLDRIPQQPRFNSSISWVVTGKNREVHSLACMVHYKCHVDGVEH